MHHYGVTTVKVHLSCIQSYKAYILNLSSSVERGGRFCKGYFSHLEKHMKEFQSHLPFDVGAVVKTPSSPPGSTPFCPCALRSSGQTVASLDMVRAAQELAQLPWVRQYETVVV